MRKQNKPVASPVAAAAFEALEARQLMSVSLNPATHVLTVTGTPGNDAITVSRDVVTGKLLVSDNGIVTTANPAQVSYIVLRGLAGNDALKMTDFVNKPSTINGGDGNDAIRGGGANDVMNGEGGNDTLDGGNGADFFNGGLGYDTADYSARAVNLNLSLDGVANDGAGGEADNVKADTEVVKGGWGNDVITGNALNNILYGNAGADTIQGMAGHDVLYGGAGDDLMDGGRLGYWPADDTGNDALYGEDGNDVLHASDWGNNYLNGGAGNDSLNGYHGDDTLVGGDGDDYLSGYRGNDYLLGGAGKDAMYAGDGDDQIIAGDGVWNEVVDGGAGYDRADVDRIPLIFTYLTMDTVSNCESVY